MTGAALVVTTVDSEAEAERIARALVEADLVACAQITPVRSLYRWNGKVEDAREYRIDLKIRVADYADVERALLKLHPYEIPEIVLFDIAAGLRPYLDWLAARV